MGQFSNVVQNKSKFAIRNAVRERLLRFERVVILVGRLEERKLKGAPIYFPIFIEERDVAPSELENICAETGGLAMD